MAAHSSILAWGIPRQGMQEPGGLQSVGSQDVRHDGVAKHTVSARSPADCA